MRRARPAARRRWCWPPSWPGAPPTARTPTARRPPATAASAAAALPRAARPAGGGRRRAAGAGLRLPRRRRRWTSRRAPGVPTVVNLWGSWCAPCREELPLLQEFADGAGDRVRVLGVISKDGVPAGRVLRRRRRRSRFPSAFDGDGELMAELGLNGLPVHRVPRRRRLASCTASSGRSSSVDGAARAGRRAPRGAAVTACRGAGTDGAARTTCVRLLDAADDLPLRHRMPKATVDRPPLRGADPLRRGPGRARTCCSSRSPRTCAATPASRRSRAAASTRATTIPIGTALREARGGGRHRPGRRAGAGHPAGAVPAARRTTSSSPSSAGGTTRGT